MQTASKKSDMSNYKVGINEEIIFNEDGNSYVTYEDLAAAMLDIAEKDLYNNKVVTIATVSVSKEGV